MKKFLEIGSLGWQHEGWQDDYYPEELPEEWRLSYFANEFRFVLVPVQDWINADEETLETWLEDVHEKFRFLFELDSASLQNAADKLARITSLYASVLNGFVYRVEGEGFETHLVTLKKLSETARVFLDFGVGREPLEADRVLLKQQGFALCWHIGEPESFQDAELGFIAASDAIRDKRRLGAMMQDFLKNTNKAGDFFVVFTGDPPPAQIMRDAVVISDLLGA